MRKYTSSEDQCVFTSLYCIYLICLLFVLLMLKVTFYVRGTCVNSVVLLSRQYIFLL